MAMTIILVSIIVATITADQLIKVWAVNKLSDGTTITVIKNIFSFEYVRNKGAGWGVFTGKTLFLVVITGITLAFLCYILFAKKIKGKTANISVALIISGGIGNLIDRVFRGGSVVDMFKFDFIDFPIFNFADSMVVIGVTLLVCCILFCKKDMFDGFKVGKKENLND